MDKFLGKGGKIDLSLGAHFESNTEQYLVRRNDPELMLPRSSYTAARRSDHPVTGPLSDRLPSRRARNNSVERDIRWPVVHGCANPKTMTQCFSENVLLGDIGATNARFALLASGALGHVEWMEVLKFPRLSDALAEALSRLGRNPIARALFAVAGPVEGGRCRFTNCDWTVDGPALRDQFGFRSVTLINDFHATAASLPLLLADDLFSLGGGSAIVGAPRVVLGPGSGLGVACLMDDGTVVTSEGGHTTFPATCPREEAVLDNLRRSFGHISAERVLSGPGLENLYRSIALVDDREAPPRSAAEITSAALNGACDICAAAIDMFCAMLGVFAGNMALTFGARGGVYIAGGIAPRIVDRLARSQFRTRFEEKGRLKPYIEPIPTHVIIHPAASFLGLRRLSERASEHRAALR
jgi:glucokinase